MPNWCSNRIDVTGEELTLIEMESFIAGEDSMFTFECVLPYPKGENIDPDWAYDHWGTKWDTMHSYIVPLENKRSIYFDTAWVHSLPVTLELSKKFPSLIFTHNYEEEGFDVSGYSVFQNGVPIEKKVGTWGEFRMVDDDDYYEIYDDDDDNDDEVPLSPS